MIYKIKKNNRGPVQYRKRKPSGSGFVILFAVTISSILLAIALGVSNIALKQVQFGTNTRDTNNAFFAADTGVESVLFRDKPPGSACDLGSSCDFVISNLGSQGESCAKVNINKTVELTTIISKGYNTGGSVSGSCNPPVNSVERELKVTFSAPASYTKIMLQDQSLTQQGIPLWATEAVDGLTTGLGWNTDTSLPNSFIKIDLGYFGGPAESVVRLRLYLLGPGYVGNYSFRYSSTTSSFDGTAVNSFIPSSDGWNEISWDSVGPYRYWWLLLENTPGAGPHISELELYK